MVWRLNLSQISLSLGSICCFSEVSCWWPQCEEGSSSKHHHFCPAHTLKIWIFIRLHIGVPYREMWSTRACDGLLLNWPPLVSSQALFLGPCWCGLPLSSVAFHSLTSAGLQRITIKINVLVKAVTICLSKSLILIISPACSFGFP